MHRFEEREEKGSGPLPSMSGKSGNHNEAIHGGMTLKQCLLRPITLQAVFHIKKS